MNSRFWRMFLGANNGFFAPNNSVIPAMRAMDVALEERADIPHPIHLAE